MPHPSNNGEQIQDKETVNNVLIILFCKLFQKLSVVLNDSKFINVLHLNYVCKLPQKTFKMCQLMQFPFPKLQNVIYLAVTTLC